MKIIISPAKKMNVIEDDFYDLTTPLFVKESSQLLLKLKELNIEELKNLWSCNDAIAQLNYERIQRMTKVMGITPALFSFQGIQFKEMAPTIFTSEEFKYVQDHLFILSGFYGLLRPFDGINPYRLEMQAKLTIDSFYDLYSYWQNKIYNELFSSQLPIINLASEEYFKAIKPFIKSHDLIVTCTFGEQINDKIIEKGTLCKMARGRMVRFLVQNQINDIEKIKEFNQLGYVYQEGYSTNCNYVFIKEKNHATNKNKSTKF